MAAGTARAEETKVGMGSTGVAAGIGVGADGIAHCGPMRQLTAGNPSDLPCCILLSDANRCVSRAARLNSRPRPRTQP